MPTNNNGETQTDALNLTETAKQVDHEVEIGFYDYGFADQITFFEAADTIGAGEGEDLNRMSEPWNENFQITFASEVEDTAAAEERATNYDPWDDNAHLYQVDQNLLAMINLANESDTFHTVEDPTLDSEDPGEAPWNTVENENPIEPEQITPTEQTRGQKLAGLARDIAKQAAPVVIGMGVKMAVKSSLAGTVGGPVLAGLAGGLGTAAVTAAKLQNGDTGMNLHISEDIDKSGVSEIHDRYVMKQKRRAEKGGKINKVLSIINAPEK